MVPQFAVAWQRLRQLQEEDATLEATVMSVNRGGLLVEAASLRGFIPTSHVSVVGSPAGDPALFDAYGSSPASSMAHAFEMSEATCCGYGITRHPVGVSSDH